MADPTVVEKKWLDLYERVTGDDDRSRYSNARNWLTFLKEQYEGRAYHNLDHIGYMRELLHIECKDLAVNIDALEWAIWFHDVIYETKPPLSQFNELWSAKVAIIEPLLPEYFKAGVSGLIRITEHAGATSETWGDIDAQLMLDLDLAILGMVPLGYEVYAERIREEYSWVPEETYRQKRAQVLQDFLDRDRIYLTDFWRDQREEQARINLSHELKGLIV